MNLEHKYTDDQLEKINKNLNDNLKNELINIYFEREADKLNYRMSQERDAGLYVLDCSCRKIARLLKVFLLGELSVIPDGSLNSVYKELRSHAKCILKNNKFVKDDESYSKLTQLFDDLPPAISDSSIRYADWEQVFRSACMLEDYVSELCHSYGVFSYTYSMDDPFITLLQNAEKIIDRHYELRINNSDKEVVKQIDGKNLFFKDINSLFKKENKKDTNSFNNQFITLRQQNNFNRQKADINVNFPVNSEAQFDNRQENVSDSTDQNRNVDFSTEGDLTVNGNLLVSVKPNSKHYFFLQALFLKYTCTISHEELFEYITNKLAEFNNSKDYPYEKSSEDFSHNCMSEIRKKIKFDKKVSFKSRLSVFNAIVISHTTGEGKPGYRMINSQE